MIFCSGIDETGTRRIRSFIADNWSGPIEEKQDWNILFQNSPDFISIIEGDNFDASAMVANPFIYTHIYSPYKTLNEMETVDTYYEENAAPEPVLLPYKTGEAFYAGTTALVDSGKILFEFMRNFYNDSGTGLSSRTFMQLEAFITESSGGYQYFNRSFLSVPSLGIVGIQNSSIYDAISSNYYAATYMQMSGVGFFYLTDILTGIPAGLKDIIIPYENGSQAQPAGSYAWSLVPDDPPTLLHACDLTDTDPQVDYNLPLEAQWFYDNPGDDEWKLFYTISTYEAGVSTVNSSQFMGILESIIAGAATDWNKARLAFMQLFPRPNYNYLVPHDSSMFHAEDDNVYVFTRKYGKFVISRTGIFTSSFLLPSEINTIPIRPTVTYSGNSRYICVCENLVAPRRVVAVYYGSPFVGWTALPMPDLTLEHVRIINDTVDRITLLGIMTDGVDHYAGFINYTGAETWQQMAKIPVNSDDSIIFDMALFGAGQFVQDMENYLTLPDILPPMPVCSVYGDYDPLT